MARERYEEALRLYVETAGDEELARLVASLGDVGDAADFQSNLARKAMERFAQSVEALGNIDAFSKLKQDLADTERQLQEAQAGAQALFREFADGDTSSPQIVRAQRDARKAVSDLEAAAQRQRVELQRLRGELSASGVDTRRLGSAQGELRQRMADARAALATTAQNMQRFRQESRTAAAQIPEDNREIARSYSLIERGAGRLRGVLAGVAGYLGLHEAVQGIRNLLNVASASENARRALQNLYGGQEAGNRAFERLKDIARDNGLAFNDVVETAKKLKSFGLDPLKGSLQALIDQNAAVGGSMEDLDGKVLALGQAWAKQKLQGEEILQLVERGVPVWDLLQKATGKNVAELQKLSEAGKLGRDTISALVAEIGKANSGAASAGLSGLSGLVAQVSARWQDFLNRIADSGVTDYFKQQLQSLLGSTGNLDALARRVANAIIGVVETVKRLALEFGPFVAGVGNATLALARHADALVLVAKAYAAVKIANFYQGLAQGLIALRATTAATAAVGAEASAAAGRVGGLGGALTSLGGVFANLSRVIKVSALGLAIDFTVRSVFNLVDAIGQYQEMLGRTEGFQRTQSELQQDQLRLGQQLQDLYRSSANVAVESGERVSKMTRDQASDYLFALEQARNYYGGVIREARAAGEQQAEVAASEKWKELGAAITAAKDRLTDLNREAAKESALHAFVDKAVAKFDELATKSKSAKEAVSDIFKGVDFGSAEGVQQAVDIIEQINARGTAAGKALQDELRTALQNVSETDLPRLRDVANEAFGQSSAAAKQLSDEVNRISLSKLGVDIDAIKSGFTKTGRVAVDAFNEAIKEVDRLGLTVEQRSTAIATAFDNAFRQASTKKELEALKQSLQDALSSGDIGFKEFQQRITETDAKLAELGGTGKQLGKEVAQGAHEAAQSLEQVGSAADSAAQGTERAADAAEGSRDRFQEASKAGQGFALTLVSVSEKATQMYSAVTEAQSAIAGSAGRFARGINEITGKVNAQAEALQKQVEQAEAAAAADDEWAKRRADLAHKFDLLGADNIERLVEAEKRAAQVQKRRLDDAQRARDKAKAEGADPTETIQIASAAQQQAAVTAQAVTDVLAGAREAASALSTASTQIAQGGEIVVRIVQEVPPGALAFRLNPAQEESIARRVVQLLLAAKKVST